MAKYKFEQFFVEGDYLNKIEIEPTSIEIGSKVTDDIENRTLTIPIVLVTETARFSVLLDGIHYGETWEDSDLESLILQRLNDFVV